jgi:hypothetical protein
MLSREEDMNTANTARYEFPELNPHERLRNLVLYIANKSQDDPYWCKTKLFKILYFADFQSYRERSVPVSGTGYKKLEHGPVPVDVYTVLEELESSGAISIERAPFYTRVQHRIVAHREADLSGFDALDIATVDRVIADLKVMNANDVSEASHGIAWESTPDNEYMPYQAAFLSDEPLTDDELAALRMLIEEHERSA